MNREYWLWDGQNTTGPHTLAKLQEQFHASTIPADAQVQVIGSQQWQALSSILNATPSPMQHCLPSTPVHETSVQTPSSQGSLSGIIGKILVGLGSVLGLGLVATLKFFKNGNWGVPAGQAICRYLNRTHPQKSAAPIEESHWIEYTISLLWPVAAGYSICWLITFILRAICTHLTSRLRWIAATHFTSIVGCFLYLLVSLFLSGPQSAETSTTLAEDLSGVILLTLLGLLTLSCILSSFTFLIWPTRVMTLRLCIGQNLLIFLMFALCNLLSGFSNTPGMELALICLSFTTITLGLQELGEGSPQPLRTGFIRLWTFWESQLIEEKRHAVAFPTSPLSHTP